MGRRFCDAPASMALDLIIRGGDVVTPGGVARGDVAIEGGKIAEVSPEVRGGATEEIDASGLTVFPGVIDSHVHFNEPGREHWEGFASGSAALAAGGGTCFFEMPLNAHPPTLDGATFDAKLAAARANSLTDFGLWGGLTPANLDRLEELADRGVVGFKAFMSNSGIAEFPAADDYSLYRGMQFAAERGLVVAVHAENDSITGGLSAAAVRAGQVGIGDYLASRPVIAEMEAALRAVTLARETGCKLHVVHVSSVETAEALRALQEAGGTFTFETCPHYWLLSDRDLHRLGAAAKCAPPLRPEPEVLRLRRLLAGGEAFDFVASDHSPAPADMKAGDDFFKIWGGISGVQSTLPAVLSAGENVDLGWAAAVTATNVASRFDIGGKGRVEAGLDADLALVDVASTFALAREMLLDRHRLSPYVGRSFRGVVRRTLVRGQTVVLDGRVVGKPGRAKFVSPVPAI